MTFPKIKIIFLGTPEFAVASLDILVKYGFDIVAVVTAPDKPAGRGMALSQSAIKQYALGKNLKILQPENLKEDKFLNQLEQLKADLQIVVAFRMLPEAVWMMSPLGTFNLHASLLPQYRGAAPINRAIMNGEKESGVTTFFLRKEMDTGNIIFREKVAIGENETAGELHDKLMMIGAGLVLKTARAIEIGDIPQIEQATYFNTEKELKKAPKIFKEDCRIDWKKSALEIHNLVRGLSPYPGAFAEFYMENKEPQAIKIFRSDYEIISHSEEPGKIFSNEKSYLKIAARDGFIFLHEVQQAGKKRMKIDEFLRGFSIRKFISKT